ncbi:nuclear transport factor 2 family protein [Pseudaestuariivita rosea]|uniref:nuclear transport factor 2 family protein n=1 Tax=Pseudaestuariivita rosea TaxID=2763263 RepID=UPI001ABABCE4|nr:nuclear transport factor 2 family protein [Pseudaestuariivita rosea]
MEAMLPKIDPSLLTDRVEQMEAAVGQGNWDAADEFFTPDVLYRVGHRPPFFGLSGIKDYMTWQNALVRWDGHDLRMKFSRGQTAVFEVDSHFTRLKDGAKIVIPCTDIYNFEGDRIADWRVYSDTSLFTV